MGAGTIYRQQVAGGMFEVSTVELPAGEPSGLQYETMVFVRDGSSRELDIEKYASRSEAEQGHQKVVAKWEEAEPVTCLDCASEQQAGPAARIGDDQFCADNYQHDRFCAVCSYEESCPEHAEEQ